MHVRINTSKSNSKTYKYTQIVQSYRNKNGTSVPKVLASFRDLPSLTEENLKRAITASREGKAVVIPKNIADQLGKHEVLANLRYLDVAVAYRIWQQCHLFEVLHQVLPNSQVDIPIAEMVAALVVHRCIAPGSKLSAGRWYPTTALAELQGLAPGKFNNTRLHRVLNALDDGEAALQSRLPQHIEASEGAFVSLFLDVTNTWFVGHGPDMAHKGLTKEGLYKRRIGIALLCDQRGFPVRWQTLSGTYHETMVMSDMISALCELSWVGDKPLIVDRAMGRAGTVEFLADKDIRFITALPVDEFPSYTNRIPYKELSELKLAGTEPSSAKDLQRVCKAAERAGLKKVGKGRYLLDLGVFEKGEDLDLPKVSSSAHGKSSETPSRTSRVVSALQLAIVMGAERKTGTTIPELAKLHGYGPTNIKNFLKLLGLAEELQKRVLAGELDGATIGELQKIVQLSKARQRTAFDALCKSTVHRATQQPRRTLNDQGPPPVRVRGVVHFHSELFIERRRNALDKLREVDAFITDLNRRLSSPNSRRTEASVLAEVHGVLSKMKLVSVYDISLTIVDQAKYTYLVTAELKEKEWKRLRRFDGFNFFVAHPDLPHTAVDLINLYFAKDAVEKDFQTIKSIFELRPVRHRTDPKVRAHVTNCILSLLVERTLEHKLATAGFPITAPAAFEILSTCELNHIAAEWGTYYTVTRPTSDQLALLRALNLETLIDDDVLAEQIIPR